MDGLLRRGVPESMTQPLRIAAIEIRRLFGGFDHRLALDPERGITVVYGPNGVGKTTILRLVRALATGDYVALQSVPYGSFKVTLSTGFAVEIRQIPRQLERANSAIHFLQFI